MPSRVNAPMRWVLALYATVLLALLPWRSLWLDELMEVVTTRSQGMLEILRGYASHSAGQSPLGALEEAAAIHVLGYSSFAARLPAAFASIAAVAGMFWLARRAGVRRAWVCALLFATFPLQARYGAEGRPYSQELAIAVWLTWLVLELRSGKHWPWFAAYALLLTAGLYTQPYVLFVAAAHAAWLAGVNRRAAGKTIVCIVLAALLYLPWYLYSRHNWVREVNGENLHFSFQAKLPLLIARELLGTGYLGTALLVVAGACASRFGSGTPEVRRLMLWCLVLPVVLAVAADARFDYFFAIRQTIAVLPAVAVLAAFGLEGLAARYGPVLACVSLALLLTVNTIYAARWFTKPREDWANAANAIVGNLGADGCWIALPSGTVDYYSFFQPSLRDRACAAGARRAPAIVLAVSPYLNGGSDLQTAAELREAGYSVEPVFRLPKVLLFKRPDSGHPAHSLQ